jgi:hypothetical protein
MTVEEAVNKPIIYERQFEEGLIRGKGSILIRSIWGIDITYPVFYFFNKSSIEIGFFAIWVLSLNSTTNHKIAVFRVTKIHDRIREAS